MANNPPGPSARDKTRAEHELRYARQLFEKLQQQNLSEKNSTVVANIRAIAKMMADYEMALEEER